MKKILFTTFLATSVGCFSHVATASFDISAEYVPTLTKEFEDGNSNINSAYNMEFVLGTSSDYDIKYYKLNEDNSITEVYYKISQTVNPDANGVNLSRNQYSATEGYFKNLSGGGDTGGALDLRSRNLGDIYADFIGNNVVNYGGAIFLQNSRINSITGDFIGNYAKGTSNSYGGAIWLQSDASIGIINGNFIGNYGEGSRYNFGGAIYNEGTITKINGDFIGNYVKSNNSLAASGGAISSTNSIGSITGDFIGNYVVTNRSGAGGAIHSSSGSSKIGNINGDFIGNYVSAELASFGGALSSYGTNGIFNSSFIGNYVTTSSASHIAFGGAVTAAKNLNFIATDRNNIFTGNYTQDKSGKIYNALFLISSESSSPTATFNVANSKFITINDNITGGKIINSETDIDYTYGYNLAFSGDGTGSININNDIINAGNVSVEGTTLKFGSFTHDDTSAANHDGKGAFKPGVGTDSVTNLSLNNATFDINNGYFETISLKSFSSNNSYLSIDINPDTMTSDVLNIAGNVTGITKLIVNASSDKDIRNQGSILFAQSTNDTVGGDTSFQLYRVYGSPYLYDIIFNDLGGDSKEWSFAMNNASNPDYNPDIVVTNAETVSYIGLHSAAIEQTRTMVESIKLKIAENKVDCGICAIYDVRYNMKPLKNVWVNPIYFNSNIKASSRLESDIFGLEAGFDIQQNAYNKLGVFASYRKGNYDLNGIGKKYYSPVGSDIDINSYIGGLYYRYDRNRFWFFSTVYGGVQQADISTKDGMNTGSDASQLGASIDFGYLFALKNQYTLEPNVGLSYMSLDFDKIRDGAGKTADFDKLGYGEVKLGLKLEKTYQLNEGPAKLYAEPSIIQTFVNGNKVAISGLGNVDTYDNLTLGRLEVGGRIAIKDGLSAYGSANYTIGSDYDAKSVAVGLNYAW